MISEYIIGALTVAGVFVLVLGVSLLGVKFYRYLRWLKAARAGAYEIGRANRLMGRSPAHGYEASKLLKEYVIRGYNDESWRILFGSDWSKVRSDTLKGVQRFPRSQ